MTGGIQSSIQLDADPSPRNEALAYETQAQAAARERANSHELAMIRARKGWVGCLTGSVNETLNTGLLILVLALVLLAATLVGAAYRPDVFGPYVDRTFQLVLTVSGFVFGVKMTR